eukprot:TRINITY_DN4530_c0_g1_i1.p1 TRINITY_DN4530_c0_g1~~TRINITY_DN4530_c0_g1_i1.p1  ORF type:complete len:468 (-),score=108.69 TRINITY_DN4530_c0_g1_i1:803-2182(-)
MDAGGRRDNRQMCKYGTGCYQKNPMHHEKFRHPEKEKNVPDDKENREMNKRPLASNSSEDEVDNTKRQKFDSEDSTASSSEVDTTIPSSAAESSEDESGTHTQTNIEPSKEKGEHTADDQEEEVFEDILPPSPENIKESIKQKFLVDMPDDFYEFFEFCKSMNKDSPFDALSAAGLKLCGPFDVLGKRIPAKAPRSGSLYLRHYRYYYDPPEFQTVITSKEDGPHASKLLHIGYFRDSPSEAPVFVAFNEANVGPKITPLADNLFGAVYHMLAKLIDDSNPFQRSKLAALQEKVKLHANRSIINGDAKNLSLDAKTPSMKLRDRQKVSTTFHGAGLVVPYDKKNDVGYREIPESNASLKKIFKNIVEADTEQAKIKGLDVLHELITNVQFANDEGDPGMGIELGLDAFAYGGESLHNSIRHLLTVGYELVNRDEFSAIISAHLDRRVKGPDVDMFKKYL